MGRVARHCIVTGRVQGVFYRASTQQQARQLSITGWVRNLPTGQVEVYACGQPEDLDAFCEWLHQGPQMARVSSVDYTDCEADDSSSFEVLA